MLRERPQLWLRRLALPSLLGEGMPERLRSTSIGLLGLVAAMGLGSVGFALQLGLPPVASGPLPQAPGPAVLADRVAVEGPSGGRGVQRSPQTGTTAATDPGSAPAPTVGSPEGTSPGAGEAGDDSPALGSPASGGVERERAEPPRPAPRAQPRQPTPAEVPTVVSAPAPPPVEPTASSSEAPLPAEPAPEEPAPLPGNGNAYGKVKGNGVGNGGVPPGQAKKEAGQG